MKLITACLILFLILSAGCTSAANPAVSAQNPSAAPNSEQASQPISQKPNDTGTPFFTNTAVPPTLVPSPTNTPTATASPTPDTRPLPEDWKNWPIIPESTSRVYEIYQQGIALGNDPQHFSKIGDCHNVKEAFMGLFDKPGWYILRGENEGLQPTIDWFAGSFDRDGYAVKGGFTAAAVLNPIWADQSACNPNESPLACEVRIYKPSIAFVSHELWWKGRTTESYEKYMRQILDTLIENGVVPILSTKADNVEGDYSINYTTAKLAYEYNLPLWNFWRAAQSLPNKGMDAERHDGFHISYEAWTVRSFDALRTLNVVWQSVK